MPTYQLTSSAVPTPLAPTSPVLGAGTAGPFATGMVAGVSHSLNQLSAQTLLLGQIGGGGYGIVYGLGLATLGRITIKDGIVEQTNFHDYLVPRMRDTPAMHVELIPSDNPPVGVGQTSIPLVAPAIGNAVAQLTDVRLRELPMSPERIKTALG